MLMAITSQVTTSPVFGEVTVSDWQKAGLLSYSVIKPVITTLEKKLVIKNSAASLIKIESLFRTPCVPF
jgi:mRNA interferase MazF